MSDFFNDADCCILAGGKSSRMNGFPKGLAEFNNVKAIDIIKNNMSCFEKVFISANDVRYKDFGLEVFEDLIKDIGPIAGLYTALSKSSKKHVFVTCCDMPFVSGNIPRLLAKETGFDAVIASDGEFEYPLVGLYSCLAKDILLDQIKSGNYKPFNFLNKIKSKSVIIPPEYISELKGFNTPNEVHEWNNLFTFS